MTPRAHLVGLGLLAALGADPAQAEDSQPPVSFGRLFHSAERRATLDRQRLLNIQEVRSLEGETLSLDGIVQRAGGKRTVWINGKAQTESDDIGTNIGVRLQPNMPGKAAIAVGNDAPTSLKVGESVNRATGERDTRLGGGSVAARR